MLVGYYILINVRKMSTLLLRIFPVRGADVNVPILRTKTLTHALVIWCSRESPVPSLDLPINTESQEDPPLYLFILLLLFSRDFVHL